MKTDVYPEGIDEAQLEQIQTITDLGRRDKLDLLLMKLKCKGASSIALRKGEFQKNDRVKNELESLGFFCEWNSENPYVSEDTIELNIANEAQDLVFLAKNNFEDNKTFGRLSGYPQTAIDAFDAEDQSRLLSDEEIPDEVIRAEWFELLHFRLSKKNWKEEVKTVEKWYKLLQKYAPNFITEYISYNAEYRIWYEAELLRQRLVANTQC